MWQPGGIPCRTLGQVQSCDNMSDIVWVSSSVVEWAGARNWEQRLFHIQEHFAFHVYRSQIAHLLASKRKSDKFSWL